MAHPDNRKRLLARCDYLAQTTNSLSSRFAVADKPSHDWITQHFKHIALYVNERGRWVAAPTETTMDALRKDFFWLGSLYITGDYGNFSYTEELKQDPKIESETTGQRWRRTLNKSLRQTLSIVIPLVLIVAVQQLNPDQKVLGLDPGVIVLLLVAWTLLAIDAALNLGIVANLTGLAKGIRDLK